MSCEKKTFGFVQVEIKHHQIDNVACQMATLILESFVIAHCTWQGGVCIFRVISAALFLSYAPIIVFALTLFQDLPLYFPPPSFIRAYILFSFILAPDERWRE